MNKIYQSRILAIDYGEKRCGIAVTDQLQIIASGLTTVPTAELFTFLKNYMAQEPVETVVVGMPKKLNNTPSVMTVAVTAFVQAFKHQFPAQAVVLVDERFTSKLAFQSMIDSGMSKKKRQDKAAIDTVAATILLQDYLRCQQK